MKRQWSIEPVSTGGGAVAFNLIAPNGDKIRVNATSTGHDDSWTIEACVDDSRRPVELHLNRGEDRRRVSEIAGREFAWKRDAATGWSSPPSIFPDKE